MEALSLVRECWELEERYESITSEILSSNEPADGLDIIRNAQRTINKKDQLLLLQKVCKHQFVHKIAECVGWKKLWDHVLDHGPSVIKGMKNLVRVITFPDHSPSKCRLCDTADLESLFCRTCHHQPHQGDNSCSTLLDSLTTMDPTFFSHVLCFLRVFQLLYSSLTFKKLNNNNTGGSDEFVGELLKYGGSGMVELLKQLFTVHKRYILLIPYPIHFPQKG